MEQPISMTPAGLEPAIPGPVGRCLIHWATGPIAFSRNAQQLVQGGCDVRREREREREREGEREREHGGQDERRSCVLSARQWC
jgi:hypothetical protein